MCASAGYCVQAMDVDKHWRTCLTSPDHVLGDGLPKSTVDGSGDPTYSPTDLLLTRAFLTSHVALRMNGRLGGVQVLVERLEQDLGSRQAAEQMWSSMLAKTEKLHHANAVHCAGRYGHRLKVLRKWVLPYASRYGTACYARPFDNQISGSEKR